MIGQILIKVPSSLDLSEYSGSTITLDFITTLSSPLNQSFHYF